MKTYHKIETVYERDEATGRLKTGVFRNATVEYLKDNVWQFTEKVDGTNIRVHWDGYRVAFGGRTDKAQIPKRLLERLEELFGGETNEELWEQKFGEKEVTLYGEGYGQKIQTNGYIDGVDFILFDVMIDGRFLARENVENIAKGFGIKAVPILFEGTLQEGIDYTKHHQISVVSEKEAFMEGLVARPKTEICDRLGNRIIVKIKYRDFKEE
jgi:ATP-dependent RNA circularization protein (DNA/RNA ligase family)